MADEYRLVASTDPRLRQVSTAVESADGLTELIDKMYQACWSNRGVGLAAPQLGINKRVIVVHAASAKFCVVNPAIVRRWGGRRLSKEGCLSFPGKQVKKMRDRFIVVEGLDENLNPMRRSCSNLVAAVVQHEIDHLDGVTIVN